MNESLNQLCHTVLLKNRFPAQVDLSTAGAILSPAALHNLVNMKYSYARD